MFSLCVRLIFLISVFQILNNKKQNSEQQRLAYNSFKVQQINNRPQMILGETTAANPTVLLGETVGVLLVEEALYSVLLLLIRRLLVLRRELTKEMIRCRYLTCLRFVVIKYLFIEE